MLPCCSVLFNVINYFLTFVASPLVLSIDILLTFNKIYSSYNFIIIHLRQLPTPPCSIFNSGVIRRSRVMKIHYRAFLSKHATQWCLQLLDLIYYFLGSRTILTLRSSIIRWYYKYSKFNWKWSTMNKEM